MKKRLMMGAMTLALGACGVGWNYTRTPQTSSFALGAVATHTPDSAIVAAQADVMTMSAAERKEYCEKHADDWRCFGGYGGFGGYYYLPMGGTSWNYNLHGFSDAADAQVRAIVSSLRPLPNFTAVGSFDASSAGSGSTIVAIAPVPVTPPDPGTAGTLGGAPPPATSATSICDAEAIRGQVHGLGVELRTALDARRIEIESQLLSMLKEAEHNCSGNDRTEFMRQRKLIENELTRMRGDA